VKNNWSTGWKVGQMDAGVLAPPPEELNHLHFATPALQRCRILRGESPAKQRQLKANSTSGAEISSHIKAKQQHDTKHGQNHL
jgi:hypothetical protein